MLSFLAPGFLIAAGLGALGIIGLHLLSTSEPKLEPLPTARFVPDLPLRATRVTVRPSDWWLMVLRVLTVLLFGAALARPVFESTRVPVARIVAADVSRAVGDPAELADSLRGYLETADAVIVFDGTAREVAGASVDSVAALAAGSRGTAGPGSLSAALIAAGRIGARLRDDADSLELVIVSPFATEERDAATLEIRALWPGGIRTVPVAAAADQRVAGDSARIEWADSGATALWTARTPDTVEAVRAGSAVMVYPFVRRWALAVPEDSVTRVHARWVDGTPAAVEQVAQGGCVRSIGFALPTEGDAMLRPDFQRFLSDLNAPCGAPRGFAALGDDVMAELRGGEALAAADALPDPVRRATPLMPWLLGAGLLLLLVELIARRTRGGREKAPRATAEPSDRATTSRSAA